MPRKKKIDARSLQAKWLDHFLTPGTPAFLNATESARQAGYSAATENSLAVQGCVNRKRLKAKISKAIDDDILTTEEIKIKIRALMDATEIRVIKDEDKEVPALSIQLGATKLGMTACRMDVKRHEHTGKDGEPIEMVNAPAVPKTLEEWLSDKDKA